MALPTDAGRPERVDIADLPIDDLIVLVAQIEAIDDALHRHVFKQGVEPGFALFQLLLDLLALGNVVKGGVDLVGGRLAALNLGTALTLTQRCWSSLGIEPHDHVVDRLPGAQRHHGGMGLAGKRGTLLPWTACQRRSLYRYRPCI